MDAKLLLNKIKKHKKKQPSSSEDSFCDDDPAFKRTFDRISNNWHTNDDQGLTQSKKVNIRFKKGQQLDSKKIAKGQQLDSKKIAKGQQLDSKKNLKKTIRQQIRQQDDSNRIAIRQQLDSKTLKTEDILSLIGKEAKLMKIIFTNCKRRGSLETSFLTTESLRTSLNVSAKRLGNLVTRLAKKSALIVTFSKRGNGGVRRFKISSENYQKALLNESLFNEETQIDSNRIAIRQQLDGHCTADWIADKIADLPSSSSSYLNTTTSEEKPDKNGLFNEIKISEKIKKIGFRKTQVEQISKIGKLSVEELQTSLEHFSFDLGGGHIRVKTNPLNMLMGILRQGAYTSSEYLKEEENELQNHLIMLREKETIRQREKKEYESRLFEEWKLTKSLQEIEEIKNKTKPHFKSAKEATFKLGESMSENNNEVLDYFLTNERDAFEKEMFSHKEIQ